ncbi:Zinc finger protein [Lachnellula hyalina]|uniref:Zinc finger protein n=1 Tax=Lachnellula hyalina TaxID=1316788 RepID=A0A8H8QUM0_9HELO|nr:Zinc finger protein [Lachnellula hyalina]TVY22460.1 Zinc finger protein [Lachnellula hyalina]
MLASRRQSFHPPSSHLLIPDQQQQQQQQQQQHWASNTITSQQPIYNNNNNTTATLTSNTFSFGADQPLFEFQPHHFNPSPSQSLMPTESANHSWLSNGQLTPTSTTRAHHHRESSLSSLGSAGPASPYTVNTSNPQVAGDIYHDFHDFQQSSSKPLTPVHTPSQEHFLTSQYSNFYHTSNLEYTMGSDGMPKPVGDAALMAVPELSNNNNNRHPGRRSMATVASQESPSTPPSYEEERQKNGESPKMDFFSDDYLLFNDQGFRNDIPKLHRTMTDAYADELYNPSFHITTAPQTQTAMTRASLSPQNDVFSQRLQTANSQHLSASNTQIPLTIPSRERSPFRQGSPLAPSVNSFGPLSPSMRLGTASHMREQQKAENDARAIQRQFERTSPEQTTPKTISPKDVDLVYQENEEDSNMPLFPPPPPSQKTQQQRQSPHYRQQAAISQDTQEMDNSNASQQSYGSMATSRRESSSAFSTSSQAAQQQQPPQQQQGNFNFVAPARQMQIPQQYPFVPQLQTHRHTSGLSAVSEDFPATLTSMESSSSEFAPETELEPEPERSMDEIKKPSRVSADTGTYTCTYHGCTLRFDTPAKLQRHKREGHRSSASVPESDHSGSGMTSEAQRNSQAGPHKCERNNPSTGKPCNTIFSRPYDLTRHEDTIHNARKQKVHCPLCTEEKSFSRNDALTRHLRVVHPEHIELSRSRRRGGHD